MTLVWINLKTTGQDPERGQILEAAYIVTDEKLIVAESRSLLVDPRQGGTWSEVFGDANSSPTRAASLERLYRRNGLLDEIDTRQPGDIAMAEEVVIGAIDVLLPGAPNFGPLCGQPGLRRWLAVHAPALHARFAERNLDIDTLYETARRWADLGGAPPERLTGRALPDLQDQVAFAAWWRSRWMPDRAAPDATQRLVDAMGALRDTTPRMP